MNTPYLYKFKNINDNLYYINIQRIEYAAFCDVPNSPHLARVYIRFNEGLIDTQVASNVAARIQQYLETFI